ncbi:hypothetical protein C8J56DRAFT_847374 [Mycena floridula]|nr:hypothetical protein C8J56DRAFT_847374 [Mycena floridula]
MARSSRRRLVGQKLLYCVSIFISLGVFLFGYDQGVMSGLITSPHFIRYFNAPDALQIGLMVSVLEVGAFVTSVAAGRVGDIIGRKGTLFAGAITFTIGGALQSFTTSMFIMVIGRIVSGLGVGLLSTIVPIYQSEISPPAHVRPASAISAILMTMNRGASSRRWSLLVILRKLKHELTRRLNAFTGNIFGYAVSVWTDYFCSFIDSDMSWRLPLLLQCIIGAILAVGSLFLPESPRWLIDTDKDDEGLRVLADLHGGDLDNPIAREEFREIKNKVLSERDSGEGRSYAVMWKRYKRRVLLAMSSQAFAQLNGINVISYYAPKVFEGKNMFHLLVLTYTTLEAGWKGRDQILMTGINALIYILSTLPPWWLVDRWGRRPILLSGASVMSISLCAMGYWMYLNVAATPNAVVVCVIIYNAAFGYSWGPIPWLYPPEIMPLTFRAKGVSLSTATNWFANGIIGAVTPELQVLIKWRLYFMHGFFCACSFVLVYFVYPETKGIPLEEMDVVFGEDRPNSSLGADSERQSFLGGPTSRQPGRTSASKPGLLGRLFGNDTTPFVADSDYEAVSRREDEDEDGEYELLEM